MLPAHTRIVDWVILIVQEPSQQTGRPAGVLLLDPLKDQLHVALDQLTFLDEDVMEVWSYFAQELLSLSLELGGSSVLRYLEDTLSLVIQIQGARQHTTTADPEQTLKALFAQHILGNSALSTGV